MVASKVMLRHLDGEWLKDANNIGIKHNLGRLKALRPPNMDLEGGAVDIKLDPLIVAARHNLNSSALHSLLEGVILKVMRMLDPVSVFCLRRTCRIFLRLFGSHEFRHLHAQSSFFESGPWVAQALPKDDGEWEHMRTRVRIGAVCIGCQKKGADPSYMPKFMRLHLDYMHCSGCNVDHPKCLFSAAQRFVTAEKRI